MPNDLLEAPAKQHAVLIELLWGASSAARRTSWAEDLTVNSVLYTSEPVVAARLPREHGGVNERAAFITWPIGSEPATKLANQMIHPVVSVQVSEVLPGDDTTKRELYFGWVDRARVGKGGNQDLVELRCSSIKDRLHAPLGIPAMGTCAWRFGDPNCGVAVVPALQQAGTIATVAEDVVTISGLTQPSGRPNYWFRGWIQVGDERVAVRRFDLPDVFYLAKRPPLSWVGLSVTATPGCDKTAVECKNWDNIERFMALGFKMPSRHPIIELPTVANQIIDPSINPLFSIVGMTGFYDVHEEVLRSEGGPPLNDPVGVPLSQPPFHVGVPPDPDTGWGTGTDHGVEYGVAYWNDLSGQQQHLSQLSSIAIRPLYVRASAVGSVLWGPAIPIPPCGATWENEGSGNLWAARGWNTKVSLPGFCSSDFFWELAYGGWGMSVVTSHSNSWKLSELSMAIPHQYQDSNDGLTFLAVCRNRVFQGVFYLSNPTELNIVTNHENHDSLIFESVGSWKLTMGGADVVGAGHIDNPLIPTTSVDTPAGINPRVYGIRVTPGGDTEIISSDAANWSAIASAGAPATMAAPTGYNAVSGHIEIAAMVMYNRALSNSEMDTAIGYLKNRYSILHPPE